MGQRQLTFIDNLIDQIDSGLRTTFASAPHLTARPLQMPWMNLN